MGFELVLHVGTHKTGSTAIQRAGAAAGPVLAEHDTVFVWRPPLSLELASAAEVDEALVDGFRGVVDEIRRTAGDRRVVVSFEGWSGSTVTGYRTAPAIATILGRACAHVDTSVVVMLRRHDAFLGSVYCQQIKVGGTDSLEAYLGTLQDDWFRWSDLLTAYADAFGADRVRPLVYELDHDPGWSAVRAFFGSLGVDGVPELASDPNPGLSRAAIDVMRSANQVVPADRSRFLRRILEAEAPAPAARFFPRDMRAALLTIYADDRARLRSEHGLVLPPWWDHDDGIDDGGGTEAGAVAIGALARMTVAAGDLFEQAGIRIE